MDTGQWQTVADSGGQSHWQSLSAASGVRVVVQLSVCLSGTARFSTIVGLGPTTVKRCPVGPSICFRLVASSHLLLSWTAGGERARCQQPTVETSTVPVQELTHRASTGRSITLQQPVRRSSVPVCYFARCSATWRAPLRGTSGWSRSAAAAAGCMYVHGMAAQHGRTAAQHSRTAAQHGRTAEAPQERQWPGMPATSPRTLIHYITLTSILHARLRSIALPAVPCTARAAHPYNAMPAASVARAATRCRHRPTAARLGPASSLPPARHSGRRSDS